MNTHVLEGNWKQLQGNIKEQWGKLTDNDLTQIQGKRDKLEGVLQEKYGYSKNKAREEVDNYLDELGDQFDGARGRVEGMVEKAQERFHERKDQATHRAREMADEYNQRLEDVVRTRVPGEARQVVEEYPWLVILAVMLVGILIGVALRPGGKS